jgi:hypothetical protein
MNAIISKLKSAVVRNKFGVAVFICFLLLYAPGIYWGMPSEFVPEIDSEFPTGPFNIIAHLHDNSFATPYPVFHRLLILPLYVISLFVFKITGHFTCLSSTWPYGFSNPTLAMTLLILIARSVSLFMGAGIVCILGLMVKRTATATEKKYRLLVFSPVIAFGLSGVVAYYSRASNYDIPQLFWWALWLFFLWKFMFEHVTNIRDLVLSALFAGLSVATKDQMVFFIAGGSLVLFIFPRNGKSLAWKTKKILVYFLMALCFYCVAAVIVQPYQWISHMKKVLIMNITSGQFIMFGQGIEGQIRLFLECVRCLSHIMTPWGVALSALCSIVLIIKKSWPVLFFLGVPVIFTYLFMFARIRFVFERYMLNYAFLFTIIIACGISLLVRNATHDKRRYIVPFLSIIIGIWLLYQVIFSFAPLTYAQCNDTKKQLSLALPAIVPAGDTISWLGSRFSLPNAKIYTRYHFAVSDTFYSVSHSFRVGHVIVRNDRNRDYVLTDHDLFIKDVKKRNIMQWSMMDTVDTSGLKLITMVQHPPFIQDNIKVYSAAARGSFRVSVPYYLYKRQQN